MGPRFIVISQLLSEISINIRLSRVNYDKNMGNMGFFEKKIWDIHGIFLSILTKIWDIYGEKMLLSQVVF